MATLTAVFQADFTNFQNAIQKTETRLKTFEQNAAKVDTTLAKMGNKFSGVKVIQDAIAMEKAIRDIGGASKLTAQELIEVGRAAQQAIDKAKALGEGGKIPQGLRDLAAAGKEASESLAGTGGKGGITGSLSSITSALGPIGPMIATTFTVGAIVGFAKEIGSFAGQMVDLSDQTGIAIEDLQALDYVAAGAGLTIEDVTGSVSQLSNRLAGGDKSAAAAMDKLGLSTQHLLSQSPDEALIDIAEAVAKIQNPMEKTAVAMDLFGKSGPKMLRLMKDDFAGLIEEAKTSGAVIDEELIRKADAFDDAWAQAVKKVKASIASIALNVISPGPSEAEARKRLEGVMAGRKAGDEGALRVSDEYLSSLASQVNAADVARMGKGLTAKGPSFGQTAALPGVKFDPLLAGIDMRTKAQEEADEKAADLEEARQKRIKEQFGRKPPTGEELERALFGMTSTEMEKTTKEIAEFETQQRRELARLQASGPGYVPGGDTTRGGEITRPLLQSDTALQQRLMGDLIKPPDLSKVGTVFSTLGKPAAVSFMGSFNADIASKFGPSIMAAIQGGGDIGKSIGGMLGESLTSNLFGPNSGIMQSLTGKGGLLGTLTSSVASFLPGIGALVGPGIDLAMKGIKKLFGGEGKETNKTRDSWIEANYGTSDNLRKLAIEAGVTDAELRKLFDVKKVKDFEKASQAVADKIGTFNDEAAADAERLTAAYEKYGFTFAEIGAKAQQSQLDSLAKELIEDWRVLIGSGIEMVTVNERMSDSINKYLQDALAVGAEIPAAMRPILERMAAQGTLTDAAGNKITDLAAAGVTFSETMTAGFDRVVGKLEELIGKIGGVGSAIDAIPDADVNVNYHYNDPGAPQPQPYDPALYDPYGGQPLGFAKGTGGKYLDFGAGTPAILHNKEKIVPLGEEEGGGSSATLNAITGMQSVMLRAIRENALAVRDQTMLAIGRS